MIYLIRGLLDCATFTGVTSLYELQEQQRVLMHTDSHDLRTPLTNILGHSELLTDRVEANTTLANNVEAIRRNIRHLNTMI